MTRAWLFDLDGTLVDRDAASGRWFGDLLARRPELARGGEEEARRRFAELDLGGYDDRARFCREVLLAFPGIAPSPAQLWHDFTSGLAEWARAEDGAMGLLSRLSLRHRVAVVTNGRSRLQRRKLEVAGLGRWPAFVSEELGLEKPDPRLFAAVATSLGVEPAACTFVGDDPERDVAGAAAAGMHTCWVSRGRAWSRTDLVPERVVERVGALVAGVDP